MKVMKFGGTSIGQPAAMRHVVELILNDVGQKIIVLSALSGTTTTLSDISHALEHNDRTQAKSRIENLQAYYIHFVEELLQTEEAKQNALSEIADHLQFFTFILKISFSEALKKDILAQGEIISSKIFSALLNETGVEHHLLWAFDFMQLDAYGEPLVGNIKVKLTQLLNKQKQQNIFVTQGNICRNSRGEVDNFGRGGSDYSASLIATAITAEVCEIWTDIDAMQNNDASIVEQTIAVEHMSFEEAAELAYFGSKILHPRSLWPAKRFNVPVKICNTLQPAAGGTMIVKDAPNKGVKAIAARDNIIAIKIKSSRMLLAYGFIKKVFEVFEKYHTSIDLITTSEVAVSLTIDSNEHLENILHDLEEFGTTEVDDNQTIVAIVGNEIMHTPGIMKNIFNSLTDIPVRMISYGGSRDNITLLINSEHKNQTLRMLNKGLFNL